ncbi:MAG: type VI secretion system tip protein TssI/VgrG [Pseudomonadota bacterium]
MKTALGLDVLAFKSLRMSEGLSRLFEMQLEFYSDDGNIAFDDVLGHNLTVALDRNHAAERYFNAYVTSFGFAGSRGRRYIYRAVASPWTWFLTRTENCRIFHEQKVDEILRTIFSENGFSDFEIKLSKSYPTYEYCVQYRETDFNFISRLMEREGIYYFYEHLDGAHKMVIVDGKAHHEPEPGYATYEYFARDQYSERRREGVFGWRPQHAIQPTNVVLQDYDFKKPAVDLTTDAAIARQHGAAGSEVYDAPGLYREIADGKAYAKTRIEELQARHAVVQADANLRGIKSGRLFTLKAHPVQANNIEYLVTSAHHELTADDYESGGEAAETYLCSFSALTTKEVFRPARLARKPVVPGPQTAFVVGKEGEEIDPDEHGRVKVRFHWERDSAPNAFSCWVRVSQAWAGNGWGAMSIPRIGQEVIVEFEEGDPDRPIITGRVYNSTQKNPYDPPANRNYTTFKTNTVKGSGFNEMRFDDTAGAEGIFFHAQFDWDRRVLNDSRDIVLNDQHEIVENNEFRHIKAEKHDTVDSDAYLKVGDTQHIQTGADFLLKSEGNIVEISGGDLHLKAGGKMVLEAPGGITLKCGGAFVTINSSGVHIQGTPNVNVNSGGPSLSGPGTAAAPASEPDEAKNETGGEADPRAAARDHTPTPLELDSHSVASALLAAAMAGKPFASICGAMSGGKT